MSDKSRRKLLKSIASGTGAIVAGKSLPETWSRPIVDSVMLPAHAETSPTETTEPAPLGEEPPVTPRFSFTCQITLVEENTFSSTPDDWRIGFEYTPIDNSGALNDDQVDTIYTITDATGTIFGPQNIVNSWFGQVASPIAGVPTEPTAPVTITIEYSDQSTYGDATCTDSVNSLPFP